MTLGKGNKVVKLDDAGKPMTLDNASESYVEYAVEELTPYFQGIRRVQAKVLQLLGTDILEESYVVVLLRKLR